MCLFTDTGSASEGSKCCAVYARGSRPNEKSYAHGPGSIRRRITRFG